MNYNNIAAVAIVVLSIVAGSAYVADATPVYAIRSGYECDSCHIEPTGWQNPEDSERRCTLSCSGCHVSPAGGGLRTPSGEFYGREALPMWGTLPSEGTNPDQYLMEGYPNEGQYSLFDGFSGWWPGEIPHTEIEERYGSIDATPTYNFGGDVREMSISPLEGGGDWVAFPMQADMYAVRNFEDDLLIYGAVGFRGSRADGYSTSGMAERVGVKELFVMKQGYPNLTYVRAGRIRPIFGWNQPDHSNFTRQGMGFGVDRLVQGVEVGYNPQYLYANASAFYQDDRDFLGRGLSQGTGTTVNFGYRALGWQAGSSFHYLDLMDGGRELSGSVQWALMLQPVIVLGEYDLRSQSTGDDSVLSLSSFQEVNYEPTKGVAVRLRHEWMDPNTDAFGDHRNRFSAEVEWNPVNYLNIETIYRKSLAGGGFSVLNDTPGLLNFDPENMSPDGSEVLVILHGWY